MGIINAINETSNKAYDSGEVYVKTSQEYFKLKAFQQLARASSFISKLAFIGGLFFLGVIFLAVSAATLLGEILNSITLACLLTAITLFGITGIVYLFRKKIDKKIIQKMYQEFFD